MHIKVDIDFEFPRWAKRTLVYVGVPSVILCGVSAVVYADAVPAVTFADGETLSAQKMTDSFAALRNAINDPDPACPKGYTQDTSVAAYVLCERGNDEVVKVGTGGSAFWVDRYEASIWSSASGMGTQYGVASDDYPATFPKNGQAAKENLLYPVSMAGVAPSANMTWFQASAACMASGKRLPDGQEWLKAAMATNDPGSNSGGGGACRTTATGKRSTGGGTTCISAWGAEDMIGNLREWTSEWMAGLGNAATQDALWLDTTGGTYNDDDTRNIASEAAGGNPTWTRGLPASAIRGGSYLHGVSAGVFSIHMSNAPSNWGNDLGFRCVIPR